MADYALVQAAIRTSTGTQDFTSSGFGTPKGAIVFISIATANGTAVPHAILGVGATDGTRSWSLTGHSKDNVSTSVCGKQGTTNRMITVLDQDGADLVIVTFNSWITDGLRVTVGSPAPAAAYLVTVWLFGGTEVLDFYASTVTTPGTQNSATTVTAPNFAGTFGLFFSIGGTVFNDSNAGQNQLSAGIVVKTGSDPPPQYAIGFQDTTAVGTSSALATLDTNSVVRNLNPSVGEECQIQEFSATGFKAYTRENAAALVVGYVLVRLNTTRAKVLAVDSPTAAGAYQIAGIGWVPQCGLLLMTSVQTTDSRIATTDAEVFGIGVFTAANQYCYAISSDDAVTPMNCESVVDSEPIHLVKDGSVFMDANFSSFANDVANFNVNTFNGTTRKWAALFLESSAVGGDQHEPFVKVLIK